MSNLREVVFVVSADRLVRATIEQVLAAEGMHTMMFESAADFLACTRPDVPACLLLDVEISDTNGLELQQQLAGRDVPVVFVTQQAQVATSVQAIKAGALDFLTLPLPAGVLLKAIRSAIELDMSARERWQNSRRVRQRLESLSPREIEVLSMTLDGMACKQMAGMLGISECTAQTHRRRLMRKLQTGSIPELMLLAQGLGIVSHSANQHHSQHTRAQPRRLVMHSIFSAMRSREDQPSWGGGVAARHGP